MAETDDLSSRDAPEPTGPTEDRLVGVTRDMRDLVGQVLDRLYVTPDPAVEPHEAAPGARPTGMSDPDSAFGPSADEPAEETEAVLLGVLRDVRDLMGHLLQRLYALEVPPAGNAAGAQVMTAIDAKVVELGAAMGSIATMLENIESAVVSGASVPPGTDPLPLVERVAAAAGNAGINALMHARIEAIEEHVESSAGELKRLRAQLDHIEDGIGYLAAALLGGG